MILRGLQVSFISAHVKVMVCGCFLQNKMKRSTAHLPPAPNAHKEVGFSGAVVADSRVNFLHVSWKAERMDGFGVIWQDSVSSDHPEPVI